jgi:hypothetical protein
MEFGAPPEVLPVPNPNPCRSPRLFRTVLVREIVQQRTIKTSPFFVETKKVYELLNITLKVF